MTKRGASFVSVFLAMVIGVMCTACGGEDTSETVYTISPPVSSDDAKGANYEELLAQFEAAGFTNIKLEPIDDLILGFLTSDGEVEEITVNGKDVFTERMDVEPNVPVVISYHTFPADEEETAESESVAVEETDATETLKETEVESGAEDIPASLEPVVLSTATSEAFAKLFETTDDYALYKEFADTNKGSYVEFDAHVDFFTTHEDYNTRYEMLMTYGDWEGENTVAPGPIFKLEDFNLFDIDYDGDRLGTGSNIHVLAKVDRFDEASGLFFLTDATIKER